MSAAGVGSGGGGGLAAVQLKHPLQRTVSRLSFMSCTDHALILILTLIDDVLIWDWDCVCVWVSSQR